MRVRGLKLLISSLMLFQAPSHPMRVRGLKLVGQYRPELDEKSHPMRVRGLKQNTYNIRIWEISVAPHAGAWIETTISQILMAIPMSHPMRVRGLKHRHRAE